MDFGLKKGMVDDAVIHELKGRVHGESRMQMQALLSPQSVMQALDSAMTLNRQTSRLIERPVHDDLFDNDLIKGLSNDFTVVDVNTELQLALVAKRRLEENPLTINYDYLMVGMNSDQVSYFVHPLYGLPDDHRTIEQVHNWMDRINRGWQHSERVQGDILCKITEFSRYGHEHWYSLKNTYKRVVGGHDLSFTKYRFKIPFHSSLYVRTKETRNTITRERNRSVSIFNNHLLLTDGRIYTSIPLGSDIECPIYIVINATYLTLEHAEHPRYTTVVPSGHLALVTAQRGQTSYYQTKEMVD